MGLSIAQPRQALHLGTWLPLVSLGVFLSLPVPSLAQAPPALTLNEAKAAALQHNWDLLAAKSGIDFARAQLIVAKEFPNPTASFSTAYIGASKNATVLGTGCGSAITIPSSLSIS